MKYWFKLVRPVNLIILAATMYFVDSFIMQPNFNTYGIYFTLNAFQFFLLVFAAICICAGGYIINDYYDVEIDSINKPEKQIIGKQISPKQAFNVYLILSAIGLAIGVYLSIYIDFWKLVTIFIIAIFLLYFYSASFKGMPLLGNLIVAFLAGLSIILTIVYEPHLYRLARPSDYYIAELVTKYTLGISIFAFALTMVREIVKTMEDVDGDGREGAKTIAVAWGLPVARIVASVFIVFTIVALLYIQKFVFANEVGILYYYILFLSLCLFGIAVHLFIAKTKQQFHLSSTLIKVVMVLGICLMPLYYLIQF